jgi:hypothetical protein
MRSSAALLTSLAITLSSPLALADGVVQPAESAKSREAEGADTETESPRSRSWEAPALGETTVRAERTLREEERIGAYAQPRWTAARRFPTTRIYVVPEGTLSLAWWLQTKKRIDPSRDVRFRSLYEVELGLGHRLQLDLYLETEQRNAGAWGISREKVELRYALADWGVLPGNPTLYLEWIRAQSGVHAGELKALVGGELWRGWHWGANAVFEHELGGKHANEYALTGAVARTLVDEKLSLGGELKLEAADEGPRRFAFLAYEVLAGPSLQWRPVPAAHIDLVALFGVELERASPGTPFQSAFVTEPMLVVGWEL